MTLKRYKEAETEVQYYENFDLACFYRVDENFENSKVLKTIVPFTFRIILAELNKKDSLDKLLFPKDHRHKEQVFCSNSSLAGKILSSLRFWRRIRNVKTNS